ncbi:holo-ACP synthase [Enterobacter mori]|uniref:holo-ACP synthase n=1 Tax=Enterobacter mori TaxID=539813 RepID=UPI001EE3C6F0|nr:holo-ACP synthase [Enterobacter mori]MCG5128424.1 holo-ACP synthase [Enterobacter mori]
MRIGTDIVEVSRIERAIQNGQTDFLHRVFTQQENIKINREDPNYERASGFWAAKEAVVKALGCGYRDGITFKDIEIGHDELGCPHFIFSGRVKEMLVEKQIENASLSISHCQNYATAVVILY